MILPLSDEHDLFGRQFSARAVAAHQKKERRRHVPGSYRHLETCLSVGVHPMAAFGISLKAIRVHSVPGIPWHCLETVGVHLVTPVGISEQCPDRLPEISQSVRQAGKDRPGQDAVRVSQRWNGRQQKDRQRGGAPSP